MAVPGGTAELSEYDQPVELTAVLERLPVAKRHERLLKRMKQVVHRQELLVWFEFYNEQI